MKSSTSEPDLISCSFNLAFSVLKSAISSLTCMMDITDIFPGQQ